MGIDKKKLSRGRGRPTKLTAEVQDRICVALRAGAYIETAAKHAGIDKATLHAWLARGAKAANGPYRHFHDAVDKAMADAEVAAVASVASAAKGQAAQPARDGKPGTKAVPGDWKAAAWYLQHGPPARRYVQKLEVGGPNGGPVGVQLYKPIALPEEDPE